MRAFVAEHDPDYLATLDEAYNDVMEAYRDSRVVRPKSIEEIEASRLAWRNGAERVFNDLTERQSTYKDASAGEVAWAVQNARLVVQSMKKALVKDYGVRDVSMADNVEWILEQNPDAKVVLWAHNGHIAEVPLPYNSAISMGDVLTSRYGEDYLSIGFVFYSGQYRAYRSGEGLSVPCSRTRSRRKCRQCFPRAGFALFRP